MLSQEERNEEDLEQERYLTEWSERKEYKRSLRKKAKDEIKMSVKSTLSQRKD